MEDPVDLWRQSERPGFAMRSNGDAAHEFCGEECWRGLQGPISQPAPCDLPMAIRDRVVATSTLERYNLAVVANRNDDQSSSVLELEARNRVEPSQHLTGGITENLSPNSSLGRPEVSGVRFSTKHTSPPSNEASPDPVQRSIESNRSICISSNKGRQFLKAETSCTSKQLARYQPMDHDEDVQKPLSPSYFAQYSHMHSTDIPQGLFPSKATRAVVQGMEEHAQREMMGDDLVINSANASDMRHQEVKMGEVTVRHPSLHGFQMPPAFPPRRRGFDPGELEGAMAAAFGWG